MSIWKNDKIRQTDRQTLIDREASIFKKYEFVLSTHSFILKA